MVMASTSLASRSLRKSLSAAGGVVELLLDVGAEALEDVAFDVADVGDPGGLGVGLDGGEVGGGAAVETDDGEVEAIVAADDLGVAPGGGSEGRWSDGGAGRGEGQGVEEVAAGDHGKGPQRVDRMCKGAAVSTDELDYFT